jgi:hypothetical protein
MVCNQCHKVVPTNQGYHLHTWAGKLVTTCYTCKPPSHSISPCGLKDSAYLPCVSPYGHPGDCVR